VSGELDALLEGVRQTRVAHATTRQADRNYDALRRRFGGLQFLPGDRVFDTVSGQLATIEPTPLRADRSGALFSLRFDDGTATIRSGEQLIFRPATPSSS